MPVPAENMMNWHSLCLAVGLVYVLSLSIAVLWTGEDNSLTESWVLFFCAFDYQGRCPHCPLIMVPLSTV